MKKYEEKMKRYERKMKNYEGKMEKYVPLRIGRRTSKNSAPSSMRGRGQRWPPVPKGKAGLPPKFIERIYLTLSTLNTIRSTIAFIWTPGHIGFLDHDAVDQAAKQASTLTSITDKQYLPDTDYKSYYRSRITNPGKLTGNPNNQISFSLSKKETISWTSSKRESRRKEVIITRLRIGHTCITLPYLINLNIILPPSCPYCQSDGLTAEHIFSCPQLQILRSSHHVPSPSTKN